MIRIFLLLSLLTTLVSCSNKEIKIATADITIRSEVPDNSPVYITKQGKETTLNKNSSIGNTHWILTIDESLTLEHIAPLLKKIVENKYHPKMHEDDKDIFIVYMDTIAKQTAFLPFEFRNIHIEQPPFDEILPEELVFDVNSSILVSDVQNQNTDEISRIYFNFKKEMTVNEYVRFMTKFYKDKPLSKKLGSVTYIY